jgi:short-subunit dehydrogenase
MKIQNKTILITGGNRGIGLASAKAFLKAGCHVQLGMRTQDTNVLNQLNQEFPGKVHFVACDMSSKQSIDKALEVILQNPPDILFNNAGQLTGGLLEEQSIEEIYSMFQVNVVGLTHLTRALLPSLLQKPQAKIIMNASVSAIMRIPGANTYAASKAAVMALTECLNIELKGTNVSTLLLLTPGIATRMYEEIDQKYKTHLDTSFLGQGIPAESWAHEIVKACEKDLDVLNPSGATAAGVWLSRHTPGLMKKIFSEKFNR